MYDIKTKKMVDRRELLRIRALTLQAEAFILRKEEARQRAFVCHHAIDPILEREMYHQRTGLLRACARCIHVARGLIKGLTLPQMETSPKRGLTETDWREILNLVRQYGSAQSLVHATKQKAQYAGRLYHLPSEVAREVRALEESP